MLTVIAMTDLVPLFNCTHVPYLADTMPEIDDAALAACRTNTKSKI